MNKNCSNSRQLLLVTIVDGKFLLLFSLGTFLMVQESSIDFGF